MAKGYYWIPQKDNTINAMQFYKASLIGSARFDFKKNLIHFRIDKYFPVGSVFHFTGNCNDYVIKCRKRVPGLFYTAHRLDGCPLNLDDVDVFNSGRFLERNGRTFDKDGKIQI